MPDGFTDILNDRLRELGNIGCGHALTALSRLTSTSFVVRVPEIELAPYNAIPKLVGGRRDEMVGVMLETSGDLNAVFMLLLRPEIASHILTAMGVPAPVSYRALPPRQKSALLELGNILCSSYMTAVSELTGMEIRLTVPCVAADMLGALLNAPIVQMAKTDSRMLYIQNVFTIEGRDWVGCMLLLPRLSSADTLGKRLGERL